MRPLVGRERLAHRAEVLEGHAEVEGRRRVVGTRRERRNGSALARPPASPRSCSSRPRFTCASACPGSSRKRALVRLAAPVGLPRPRARRRASYQRRRREGSVGRIRRDRHRRPGRRDAAPRAADARSRSSGLPRLGLPARRSRPPTTIRAAVGRRSAASRQARPLSGSSWASGRSARRIRRAGSRASSRPLRRPQKDEVRKGEAEVSARRRAPGERSPART